ncbi:hypothetical protein BKA82DRAFT_4341239 [Pisolithus tinctorius]|nr:hypothetical protein BKA82DRAFT_4341239 [Pisolithus tinctorius]
MYVMRIWASKYSLVFFAHYRSIENSREGHSKVLDDQSLWATVELSNSHCADKSKDGRSIASSIACDTEAHYESSTTADMHRTCDRDGHRPPPSGLEPYDHMTKDFIHKCPRWVRRYSGLQEKIGIQAFSARLRCRAIINVGQTGLELSFLPAPAIKRFYFDVRNSRALGVELLGRSANRRYCGRSVFDSSLPKRDGLPSVDSKILEYTISAVTVLIQLRQQTGTQDISCRKRIFSYKRQPLEVVFLEEPRKFTKLSGRGCRACYERLAIMQFERPQRSRGTIPERVDMKMDAHNVCSL